LCETQPGFYNLNDENTDVTSKFPEVCRDLKIRHLIWLRQFAK